jgi:hypothetical protein
LPDVKKKNIGYSRQFVNSFYMPSLFPDGFQNIEPIAVLSNKGHETAEERLIKDSEGNYHIGQPVCRGRWYKVPENCFSECSQHWNKIHSKYPERQL